MSVPYHPNTVDQIEPCTNGLGLIWYGTPPKTAVSAPFLSVPMPLFDHRSHGLGECWPSAQGTVIQGEVPGGRYRHDEVLLFGVLEHIEPAGEEDQLAAASQTLYERLFTVLNTTGFLQLWRTWNYLPDIHGEPGGLERYRQFNMGRQAAYTAHALSSERQAPAACALGSRRGPIQLAFLAGKIEPIRLENPRQISAYHYPSEYGPKSPTFSRATLVPLPNSWLLLISGTASIIGHESRHPDSVRGQTREILANLSALLGEANARLPEDALGFRLSQLQYRIYVRHAGDVEKIQRELRVCLGEGLDTHYVQAEVCRQELLVEIEATGSLPRP